MDVKRELLLLFVAYHPSEEDVLNLQNCLLKLSSDIGYAVVVNSYMRNEPIERLASKADLFVTSRFNLGYGRAINLLVSRLDRLPQYIAIMNTDLTWLPGSFDKLLAWMYHHPDVSLAVPQICDQDGLPQLLCKRDPTLLALISRRFVPEKLKPNWLKRYDKWYNMSEFNYNEVFESTYLSGCCMIVSTDSFLEIGGFDKRYFLYLEDADLTRSLSLIGKCVHLPIASVTHNWGRGNYKSVRLMLVNLVSAWHYFCKWGWQLW